LLWWVMLHSMAYRAMAFNVRDLPHGFWSHSNQLCVPSCCLSVIVCVFRRVNRGLVGLYSRVSVSPLTSSLWFYYDGRS